MSVYFVAVSPCSFSFSFNPFFLNYDSESSSNLVPLYSQPNSMPDFMVGIKDDGTAFVLSSNPNNSNFQFPKSFFNFCRDVAFGRVSPADVTKH